MSAIGYWLAWPSMDSPLRERLFPLIIGSAVALFATLSTIRMIVHNPTHRHMTSNKFDADVNSRQSIYAHDIMITSGWVGALWLGTYLAGHMIAIPLFIFAYMLFEKVKILVGLATAAISASFIHFILLEWLGVTLPAGRTL